MERRSNIDLFTRPIDPDTALHSCKGFRLFSSEKVGRDRLETNRMQAEQNVRGLIGEYGSSDTGGLRTFLGQGRWLGCCGLQTGLG